MVRRKRRRSKKNNATTVALLLFERVMCDLMIKGVGVSCAKVKTVFLNKLSLSQTRTFCVLHTASAREGIFTISI